jgi:hypothetical protein
VKRFFSIALVLALALPALAQSVRVGAVAQRVKGNITGASPAESAAVVVTKLLPDDEGYVGRLVVFGPGGKALWQGPVPKDFGDRAAFVSGPAGTTHLQVAGDLDGDGKGEVVAQEMQSDVRVPHFRVLRWNGRGLAFVRSQGLVETPPRSGHFVWVVDQTPRSRWVGEFKRIVAPGRCLAVIGSEKGSATTVTLKATARGFDVAR